jgi:L-fuculokinase
MPQDLIAVLDVGKTNAKLILVEAVSGEITWSIERRSTPVVRAGIRELPVAGIERWLLSGLASAPHKERIRALVPVAHGAAAVLVSSSGETLLAPDYEDTVFETVSESYRPLRDPFEATFSPLLPLGLNLGRQFHYVRDRHPHLWNSAAAVLLYPQYWAWRLCGVMASEVTSLGCHSDLWLPLAARFSALVGLQGWSDLFPPLREAGAALGNISQSVAQITGLNPSCRVLCGIHDSNASYLCQRIAQCEDDPFAVISSGTWTVVMAHGANLTRLREDRDMLANVDALGAPVATARFMGGREYEAIAGSGRDAQFPTPKALMRVLDKKAFALPSFASAGGPFAGRAGTLVNAQVLDDAERGALATIYCALQADLLLDLLGASGNVIVDGPFAKNPLYGPVLAALRPGSIVLLGSDRAGSVSCARHLCGYAVEPNLRVAKPLECKGFEDYRLGWRALVELRIPGV